ncbi:hypothetical protein OF83DRAFT_1140389 [Amylostereum chailletii]|nr:hypothetical protein OF83DRAFT_1140389 [Amylostereum chailletii]
MAMPLWLNSLSCCLRGNLSTSPAAVDDGKLFCLSGKGCTMHPAIEAIKHPLIDRLSPLYLFANSNPTVAREHMHCPLFDVTSWPPPIKFDPQLDIAHSSLPEQPHEPRPVFTSTFLLKNNHAREHLRHALVLLRDGVHNDSAPQKDAFAPGLAQNRILRQGRQCQSPALPRAPSLHAHRRTRALPLLRIRRLWRHPQALRPLTDGPRRRARTQGAFGHRAARDALRRGGQ